MSDLEVIKQSDYKNVSLFVYFCMVCINNLPYFFEYEL